MADFTVYPLSATVQDVRVAGQTYELALQLSLHRMGADVNRPNHYRICMTAPDADLTFHYVNILHPFNYKSMRLEQRLKVEFREFDGFLRHQLERVQQDPLVELHLDLRGDGRAELVIRQRLPRHPTLGGRVDVVQLPFERSSTEQVQQFMREKLTKVQDQRRLRNKEWLDLVDVIGKRNPGLLLTLPQNAPSSLTTAFSWTKEFAELEQQMQPRLRRETATMMTLYTKTMLAPFDGSITGNTPSSSRNVTDSAQQVTDNAQQVTIALAGYLLPQQEQHECPHHYKLQLTSTAFRPRTFQSLPFSLDTWADVLGMEARSLTAGHNTLVKIVRALIERCVADGQQLLEWSRRNRATAPSSWTPSVPPLSMSDHTGSHRLDIRPHPDDTHPGLQLRIIEDFGFREHPVLCTSLLPIDDADALAAMQYEYQTVSKDVRAVEEKLGALLTTVRRRNPALLVWLHDRFRVVMEGAGKPVFHEEFRYGADE